MVRFFAVLLCCMLSWTLWHSAFAHVYEIDLSEPKSHQIALGQKVQIIGPERLTKTNGCSERGGGGHVIWGDGSQNKGACSGLSYVYTTAGTYEILGSVWHAGPRDQAIRDWQGRAMIEVTSAEPEEVSLEILKPLEGYQFSFEEFPTVSGRIETDEKLYLETTLLDDAGRVLTQHTDFVSYDGKFERILKPQSKDYIAFMRQGPSRAKVKARLLNKNQDEVKSAQSGWFTMTPVIKSSVLTKKFELSPKSGKAPLEVKAFYTTNYPECFQYEIYWGDHETVDPVTNPNHELLHYRITNEGKRGCGFKTRQVEIGTHTYHQPGEYKIKFKTNDIGKILEPVYRIPEYMEDTIKVTD